MVFMRKRMVESPFQPVLRCFENVLRRNVPTSGLKEPDLGTFLYNNNLKMLTFFQAKHFTQKSESDFFIIMVHP